MIDNSKLAQFLAGAIELYDYNEKYLLTDTEGNALTEEQARSKIAEALLIVGSNTDTNFIPAITNAFLKGSEPYISIDFISKEPNVMVEGRSLPAPAFESALKDQGVNIVSPEKERPIRQTRQQRQQEYLRQSQPRAREMLSDAVPESVIRYANDLGYLAANTTITISVPQQREEYRPGGKLNTNEELNLLLDQLYDQMLAKVESIYPNAGPGAHKFWARQRAFEAAFTKRDVSHTVRIRLKPGFDENRVSEIIGDVSRPTADPDNPEEINPGFKATEKSLSFSNEYAYRRFRDALNLDQTNMPIFEFNREYGTPEDVRKLDQWVLYPDMKSPTVEINAETVKQEMLKEIKDPAMQFVAELAFNEGTKGNVDVKLLMSKANELYEYAQEGFNPQELQELVATNNKVWHYSYS